MAIVFYVLGGLLISGGGLWLVVEGLVIVQSGRYIALVPIGIATAYIMLAGALFVAIGAIIHRLDVLAINTRPRVRPTLVVPDSEYLNQRRENAEASRERWR